LKIDVEPTYKEHRPKSVGGIKEVQLPEGRILRIGLELGERE